MREFEILRYPIEDNDEARVRVLMDRDRDMARRLMYKTEYDQASQKLCASRILSKGHPKAGTVQIEY